MKPYQREKLTSQQTVVLAEAYYEEQYEEWLFGGEYDSYGGVEPENLEDFDWDDDQCQELNARWQGLAPFFLVWIRGLSRLALFFGCTECDFFSRYVEEVFYWYEPRGFMERFERHAVEITEACGCSHVGPAKINLALLHLENPPPVG